MCQAVGDANMSMQRLMEPLALSFVLISPGCGTMANMDGRRLSTFWYNRGKSSRNRSAGSAGILNR